MVENNILTVVGPKEEEFVSYPYDLGVRHLDNLKKANDDLKLNLPITNEALAALSFSEKGYLTIMNANKALVFFVPERLSSVQIEYLETQKEKFYELEQNGIMHEISIYHKDGVDYNHNEPYRELRIEQKIAGYEGRKIDSQLDILYEEVENQKKHQKQ